MASSDKLIMFLCSGTAKAGERKLSYRIARYLEQLEIGVIGTLQHLSEQHSAPIGSRNKMLFINDCRAACVKVLTHGFADNEFLFFDVSPFISTTDFDVARYVSREIMPTVEEKWDRDVLGLGSAKVLGS